jgi:hypothetical protein
MISLIPETREWASRLAVNLRLGYQNRGGVFNGIFCGVIEL